MDIIIVGPGRAGMALGLACRRAGHTVSGVVARAVEAGERAASALGAPSSSWDEPLPPADLLLITVRDDAIEEVADRLAPRSGEVGAAVHVSGLKPVAALASFASPVGSFHPLQTLPSGEAGAARLAGAWVAITTTEPGLRARLEALALSIGMHPFLLADELKPLYHAAAAAAANYSLGALGLAADLFAAAGVDFDVAEPLVRAIVDNAFEMGPWVALTGPIARGDVGTVRAQLQAVRAGAPAQSDAFREMGRALARLAGSGEMIEELS